MAVASVEPAELSEQHLGFRLGPRINAAGRMRRADAALELLLTEDEVRAKEVARELDLLNGDRRETETRIQFAAETACAAQASRAAMVVAGEGWHPGVVGIVASRLVERWRRPCVVVALEDGAGRGSGRSISAYDLHAGLAACAQHLTRFGGHRMAAGVELEASALDDFARALATHAGHALTPSDMVRARACGRRGARRASRARAGRRARVPAPLRDGQPTADAARARRALPARGRDGRREAALALHPGHRGRVAIPRCGLRHGSQDAGARPGRQPRHCAASGAQPLERDGRAAGAPAGALSHGAGRPVLGRGGGHLLGAAGSCAGARARWSASADARRGGNRSTAAERALRG